MSRRVLGCLLLLPVLGVAACGGGGGGGGPGSFVGRASNAAVFVQWTQNGDKLTGSLQEAIEQGSPASDNPSPESITNNSSAFSGTVSGSSVTLSLNQGLGSVSNLTGTLNGGELDLNLPGKDGRITTVQLRTGTATDYNNDVSNLQAQVGRANAQAQQTQAAQQQAATSTSATTTSVNTANLAAVHQLIIQSFEQAGGASLPAAFRACFEQRANATTAAQLNHLLSVYASGGPAAAQAQSVAFGRQLGLECLSQPAVVDGLRASFIAPVKASFQTANYSAAFKQCVLGRLEQVSAAQLEQFALNPASARSLGYKFGRDAAKACIASGAKP